MTTETLNRGTIATAVSTVESRDLVIDFGRLGAAVKRRLETTGQTQQEAADETGLTAPTFSRLLSEFGRADIENVYKICRWLDVPIAAFLNDGKICQQLRTVAVGRKNTLEIIVCMIHQDPAIKDDAKNDFAEIFAAAYGQLQRLAAPEQPAA